MRALGSSSRLGFSLLDHFGESKEVSEKCFTKYFAILGFLFGDPIFFMADLISNAPDFMCPLFQAWSNPSFCCNPVYFLLQYSDCFKFFFQFACRIELTNKNQKPDFYSSAEHDSSGIPSLPTKVVFPIDKSGRDVCGHIGRSSKRGFLWIYLKDFISGLVLYSRSKLQRSADIIVAFNCSANPFFASVAMEKGCPPNIACVKTINSSGILPAFHFNILHLRTGNMLFMTVRTIYSENCHESSY